MAKGFKFPAPKGFAKGGMCSPKGAKAYAKGGYAKGGGPIKGTNVEASDLYETDNDMASVEAGRNVPRENKNRMRSESTQMGRAKANLKREYDDMYSFNPSRMMKSDVAGAYNKARTAEDETGGYKKGGKVKRMAIGGNVVGAQNPAGRVASSPNAALPEQQRKTGLGFIPERPIPPMSKHSSPLPLPRPTPGPTSGTAISPASQGRSTGLPFARNPGRTSVTAISPSNPVAGSGTFAKGGKVAMKKMKSGRTFAKIKNGYADGGEVETEQTASKSTRVKMPRGAKTAMPRAKSVPVASRQPMIQPQTAADSPLAMRGPAPSPLSRVANAAGPRMGMKMGGKAKKC